MATAIEEIRKGFRWEKAARFQKAYGLKDEMFAQMIGISARSLTRHRNEEEPLDPVASDRFYRVAQVIELATDVFEGKEPAMQWLKRPQPGLGKIIPLEMLDTEPGSHAVKTLLTQIEYSVLP
jgi:putative toxin-antitoxin system antitoxin component (TIGR02293 family)